MAQLLQRFKTVATPVVRYTRALTAQQYRFNQTSAQTNISTLPSGLRVVSESDPAQKYETSTIAVVVNTGSSYETAQNNGVAHFLEHLAFKGTAKRTAIGLELEVENMGATLNAYTSREHTVYVAKVFNKDVSKAVDILADIIQNPKHSEEAIQKERGVILREMQEVEKVMEEKVFDHLHSIAFQGSPLGYTILGPVENINKFTRNDFTEYIKTHYTADRMLVVGTGAVSHSELEKLVEANFSSLPSKSPLDFSACEKPIYTGSGLTIADDRTNNEVTVAVAVEGASWSSPDHVPLLVMQSIVGNYDKALGGGKNLSSRLGELVATEDLARKFSSFNTCYNGSGLFGNYFVTTGDKAEDMTCEVLSEYVRIAHDVTEAELQRAKRRLKAATLMQADGPSAACEEIGRQVMSLGRRVTPSEMAARIDAIDVKTIRDVATRYCTDTEPSVVAYGDVLAFPDYNQVRGWTHWWRV